MKKKTLIIFIILITLMNTILPIANAAQVITRADLKKGKSIKTHLKFKHQDGTWHNIQCNYIYYETGGEKYPTYCITHGVHGVDEEGPYTVTINDLLKDKLVYNTILNGYPYKTPKQLGLETSEEAYVATKQAVNTVLLNRDVKTFYKAADSKGEAIIDAIYEISEKGKAGKEVNKSASITISKIGDLTEKGEYYYQEYRVSADVNISNYTIKSLEGFSKDCFTADINGNKKSEFTSSQNFRVMIPKNDLKQNIAGKVKLVASCNTKSIFYGEAPRGDIQNYAVTYKPYTEYEKSIEFRQDTNTASIKVIKQDEDTKKPIKDVLFSLYKENGDYITSAKTDENGIAIFHNLYQGKYKVKETKSSENYIQDNTVYEVNTEYNKQVTKTITNAHKKGNLKIIKVDKDDNDITLGGIEFDLIDSNKKTVAHLITDANGQAEINNINIGKYILKETKTKENYNLCIDHDIEVKWNETLKHVIENEKKKGQIKIIKQDKEKSEIKLAGVEFQIIDGNHRILEKIKTDKNGEAITSYLPIGNYTVKEVSLGTNIQYILNDTQYALKVEDKKVTSIVVENEHKKGNLKIVKVDKDNPDITLGAIEFDLLDENKEIVAHLTTDADGEAEIRNINIGRYTLKETKTKREYNLCENENITVEWNKTSKIVIANEKKKGQVEVYKQDKENDKIMIQGVEFAILNEKQQVVDKLVTDKNGYAISKKLPIGNYLLKEVKTNQKYILTEEIFKIEIQENQISKLKVKNEKAKGKVQIMKISSKDSPILNIKRGDALAGVIFDIYNENGILVDTVITDEAGHGLSKELEMGRYKVVEKSTNPYYLLNINEFLVNIERNKEIKTIQIENEPIIPLVHIEKTGEQTAEKNKEIKYEFDIQNKSNSALDSFMWKEYIPYQTTKVTKMVTGIYNENLNYTIYYKTNQNAYRLLKEVNTCKSEYLSFDILNLEKNEVITEIKVEYGNVSKDFKCIVSPCIFAKVNDNVKKGDIITNITELIGQIGEHEVKDKSTFKTIIEEKEILKKLPKTGC